MMNYGTFFKDWVEQDLPGTILPILSAFVQKSVLFVLYSVKIAEHPINDIFAIVINLAS